MRFQYLLSVVCLVSLTVAGAGCRPTPSETGPGAHFAGRTVRIIVPYGPGGGFDNHARLLSRHLGRYLPGEPTVIIENMPGAGGLVAARYFARRVEPDGLTLALLMSGLVIRELVAPAGEAPIEGGFSSLPVIGSPSDDLSICVLVRGRGVVDHESWSASPSPPRMGMTGPGSGTYTTTLLVSRSLGLPIRPVVGYQGTAEIKQAMDSGEIDGTCTTDSTFDSVFGDPTGYVVVVQTGRVRAGRFPDVPPALDLAPDPVARELLETLALTRSIGRFYALPAGTPDEIVGTMREAFDRAMRDPQLLAEAATMRLPIRPRDGDEVASTVRRLLDQPTEARSHLARALDPATLRQAPGATP